MPAKTITLRILLFSACLTAIASHTVAQTTARDYCNRGVARQKKGDLDGALADYTRAIELNPHDAAPYNNRGLLKMAKGDLDGALADYDRALQISPRNFEIRGNRGVARQKSGDLDGALSDYDIAIKLYHKYALAYRNRGSVKMARNDLDGALNDFNHAIEFDWKDATAYNSRGLVEKAKGDLEAATNDFNVAKKLDSRYGHNNSAVVDNSKFNAIPPDVGQAPPAETKPKVAGWEDNSVAKPSKEQTRQTLPDNSPASEIEPENIAAIYDRNVARQKKPNSTPAQQHESTITSATAPLDRGGADLAKTVDTPSIPDAFSHPIELEPRTAVRSPDFDTAANDKDRAAPGLTDQSNTTSPTPTPAVAVPNETSKVGSPAVIAKLTSGSGKPTVEVPRIGDTPHNENSATQETNRQSTASPENIERQSSTPSTTPPDRHAVVAAVDMPPLPSPGIPKSQEDLNSAPTTSSPAGEPEPRTPSGYADRAQFRKAIGDLNGALLDYDRAIQLDPKYATAYNSRGNVKRAKHDLDGAIADYNRAIELNGGGAIAYYNRGVAKQTKGDLDGALTDFNPAIELDPKNAAAYRSRGIVRAMKGDLDGALADYNHAIELDPKDGGTYSNRATVYFSTRNWATALEDYNRFLELSKQGQDYPRLYMWLIRTRTGHPDAANQELQQYLEQRQPGAPADWYSNLGSYLLGKMSDADLLNAAKSDNKTGQLCEAWFYVGMKKLLSGDKTGAQDCFQKSLATNQKDYTEYHFARAELKSLQQ